MQTKLRMPRVFAFTFVAGLLWTSALTAATAPKDKHSIFGGKPKYVGTASWYGKREQGRKMANGKPFDRHQMTAAAWNIPLGTMVHVVNLKNGTSVNVMVTDRGPNTRLRRAIDLSEAAATRLDYIDEGLTRVFIIPVSGGQFESSQITAQLIEPVDDAPAYLTPLEEDRRSVAMAMAVNLGLVGQ
jgi:rare lipoprotein A (peptidoglycan hydrolase)